MERRLAAILAADVVGYSRLVGRDEAGTLAALNALRAELVDPKIVGQKGRIFKATGDGILAEFPSVVNAVACAVDIQRGMQHRNLEIPEDRQIRFRIGVNLGDVIVEEGDIFGDGVNVAARVEAIAEPGGVALSATVHDHIGNRLDITFDDMGEQVMKNIDRPIRVYRARWDGHLVERPAATRSPMANIGPPAVHGGEQPSVIVMPFDNLSGDADEYFVDGVVEEITSTLSRVREFFVIARQSAFAYKGRFVDVREVGKELGVGYVVEGTVRRGGDRLRISVQLIDAPSRRQLWSERYEGATTDVFVFQDRIAAQVAGAISPAVRNAEIDFAGRKPPGSLRAYDFVLRAYPKIWSSNPEENRQAIASLTEAIGIDPKYGRAHALLAWCHSQQIVYVWSSDPDSALRRARAAIETAAGLIGDDPTAMAAVGAALSLCDGDQERAASYIEKALTLDPSNAWAWGRYGWVALYRDDGEWAKERFERALELSPFDPLEFNLRIGIAIAVGIAGEYGRAAKMVREVLNRHPQTTWANRQIAMFSALAGDLPAARDAMARLVAAHPNISVAWMKANNPFRHAPRIFALMLEGWRLAGMPEE